MSLRASIPLTLALTTLGRFVPRETDEADAVIVSCQRVLSAELKRGNLPVARWLAAHLISAERNGYEGIAEQLKPLVADLGPCLKADAALAADLLPLLRDAGHKELYEVALRSVRSAICTQPERKSQRKAG